MENYALRESRSFSPLIAPVMQSDLIFFEIRSESLNKSAMSCCSFVGIYCCVYANVMNSARMQFLVGCYYGAESETSCYNQKY